MSNQLTGARASDLVPAVTKVVCPCQAPGVLFAGPCALAHLPGEALLSALKENA